MNIPDIPVAEIVEPEHALWGTALQPAGCAACGQAHLVEETRLGAPCPACARGRLEPQPARLRPEPPERIIPFRLKPADLGPLLERFTKPVWLRPDDFTVSNLLQRLTPVYLPMWLVDGELRGEWQAEAGFDYQVQSSQESYSGAGWQTRQVVETRVRWEPRLGTIQRRYDNLAVPALSDHARLDRRTGEYRLQESVPVEPGRLHSQAGAALVRVPDQPPESAWPLAKDGFERAAAQDCLRASGAQHVRRFSIRAEYDRLNWTQLLLPAYSTFYRDDTGAAQVITINAQTGRVAGPRLASQRSGWRLAGISAASAAGIFLLGLLAFALAVVAPPAAVLGVLLVVIAFALGAFALVPAVWPWQWNKREQGDWPEDDAQRRVAP